MPRVVLQVALGSLLFVAGCGGGSGDALERPNIILISVDTLRADHLGCYGYFRDTSPNIDRLASESILFERAYATMATTLPSHASMFTGRYPLEHGILANLVHGGRLFGWKKDMLSFAQVAKDEGYTTAGFIAAAPLKAATGISLGFDEWHEPELREHIAEEMVGQVTPWVRAHAAERFFLFLHFYDPHWKHRPPEPYRSMYGADDALDAWLAERGIDESAVRSQGVVISNTRREVNRYCGEVKYTDSQLGLFFDQLTALGLWENTVVILVSDHGEGLNQHNWASHGLVWEEQLRVPMMIRLPGGRGDLPTRFEPIVSLVDLFPTVMARIHPFRTTLAQQFLDQATGVDVLDPAFEPRPVFAQRTKREVATDQGTMYSFTDGEWKYIYQPEQGDHLYARGGDPHELTNLVEENAAAAAAVRDRLLEAIGDQTRRGELLEAGDTTALDPATLKQLEELGYLGGAEVDDE
jgi:arylsulfatase A-like enzyme